MTRVAAPHRRTADSGHDRPPARHLPAAVVTDDGLTAALSRAGLTDVDDSGLARALYSSDASLYRVLPRAVVRPRHADEIVAALEVCRSPRRPADRCAARAPRSPATPSGPASSSTPAGTCRGCSTSTPRRGRRRSSPASCRPSLQRAVAAARPALRARPEHAQPLHGRRDDRQQRLRLARAGLRPDVGQRRRPRRGHRVRGTADARARTRSGRACWTELAALVDGELATIRTEFGRFGRQVSGYSLEHLLPERGFDVARALVGSEGTLALVARRDRAAGRRRPVPRSRRARLPDDGRRRRRDPGAAAARPDGGRGAGRADRGAAARRAGRRRPGPAPRRGLAVRRARPATASREVAAQARGSSADAGALDALVVTDPAQAAALWRIREDGAGLAARTSDGRPGARRLGGRRRPARAARRLPARLRRAAGRARAARRAVRPLRRRLRARADRLPVRHAARRPTRLPGLPRGRRPAGRRLRRLAVRRARRRPGPQRAAAADVLPRRRSRCSRGQGGCSTRTTCSTPACSSPGAVRRRHPRRGGAAACRTGSRWPTGTTAATSPPAVHRCTGVGKCRADLQPPAGHVPVLPGHPRGEGHHPRPGPGAAGDARARRTGARTGARRRCTTRSTCACPARAARATARPGSTWPPTRPRCCTRPTGAGCARGRTTRWAGCRAGPTWPPGRPRLANAVLGSRLGGRVAKWSAGHRPAPRRCRRSPAGRSGAVGRTAACGTDGAAGGAVGGLVHRPLRPGGGLAAVAGAGGRRLPGAGARRRHLLRAHLDHHRPARRGPDDPRRAPSRPWRRWPTPACRSSAWSRPAPPSCAATPSSCVDEPGGRPGGRGTRTLAELLTATPGLDAARPWPGWRSSPSRTATTPRCSAGTPTQRCCERAGATVTRLGGCCGLAGNFGVERGHYDVSVTVAEQQLLPAVRDLGRTPSCWPTASPAAPSSTTWPSDGACTSPSCWPPGSLEVGRRRPARTRRGGERPSARAPRRSRVSRPTTGRSGRRRTSARSSSNARRRPRPPRRRRSAPAGLDRGGLPLRAAQAARTTGGRPAGTNGTMDMSGAGTTHDVGVPRACKVETATPSAATAGSGGTSRARSLAADHHHGEVGVDVLARGGPARRGPRTAAVAPRARALDAEARRSRRPRPTAAVRGSLVGAAGAPVPRRWSHRGRADGGGMRVTVRCNAPRPAGFPLDHRAGHRRSGSRLTDDGAPGTADDRGSPGRQRVSASAGRARPAGRRTARAVEPARVLGGRTPAGPCLRATRPRRSLDRQLTAPMRTHLLGGRERQAGAVRRRWVPGTSSRDVAEIRGASTTGGSGPAPLGGGAARRPVGSTVRSQCLGASAYRPAMRCSGRRRTAPRAATSGALTSGPPCRAARPDDQARRAPADVRRAGPAARPRGGGGHGGTADCDRRCRTATSRPGAPVSCRGHRVALRCRAASAGGTKPRRPVGTPREPRRRGPSRSAAAGAPARRGRPRRRRAPRTRAR